MVSLCICRICENQSHLIDISMNSNYIEQYLSIGDNVSYDINDGLPQSLCRFCITQLLHFEKFKQKCKETYRKFKDLSMQTQIEARMEINSTNDDSLIDQNNASYDNDVIPVYSEYTNTEPFPEPSNHLPLLDATNEIKGSNAVLLTDGIDFDEMIIDELTLNRVKCKLCGKKSRWYTDQKLRLHTIKAHSNSYKCDLCHKTFSTKHNLIAHAGTHAIEKPFKCQICNKSLSLKASLDNHIKNHSAEKPFKCQYCDKCFSSKQHFTKHVRMHTGEKPYKCGICDRSFALKSTTVVHIKTHTGEKPFKCKVCDKSFLFKQSLNRHYSIHSDDKPYKCESCDKCFKLSRYLNDHTRMHTGEKPYICEICGRCFRQIRLLNEHTRTHTGERSSKCQICDKSFASKEGLRKHTRKIHINVK